MSTTELNGALSATITAQNTGIGTYPGTTGTGVYKQAGIAGSTAQSGIDAGVAPSVPFAGLDLQDDSSAEISVLGTFTATISLDRSFDGGLTWRTIETYTAPVQKSYASDRVCLLRLFCATGNFTSGSAVVELGKG